MADSRDAQLYLGMMSGTSLDGVDAALVETDGRNRLTLQAFETRAYTDAERAALSAALVHARDGAAPNDPVIGKAACIVTDAHVSLARGLMKTMAKQPGDITALGFHGQTVLHAPERRFSWQIGDPQALADILGLPVVADLRQNDLEKGGEGAPLAPVAHRALFSGAGKPLAILNIGGVSNVTWIGEGSDNLIAFDAGPGNALLDDWVVAHDAGGYDPEGSYAAQGKVDRARLSHLMKNPYFDRPPPKSLDRDDFRVELTPDVSLEGGAATLTAFTVEAIGRAKDHLPQLPLRWLVTGGGRHNTYMMECLSERLQADVAPVEMEGINGDALEALAWAYMAARHLAGLPVSFPGTTGAPRPLTGGRLYKPGYGKDKE